MINGVLTERTVKEVAPMVRTNLDGLKKTLEELVKQYKSKQDEMEKWKVRFTHSSIGLGQCSVANRNADTVTCRRRTMSRSSNSRASDGDVFTCLRV